MERIVHTGYVNGVVFGIQEKHSVSSTSWALELEEALESAPLVRIGWTCPKYPAVPLSTIITPAAMHILLTCRLASRLSRAFNTRSNSENHETENSGSKIDECIGVIFAVGQNGLAVEEATRALECPTSFLRKKNCRLRLERSMVSRSRRVMSEKEDRRSVFTTEQVSARKQTTKLGDATHRLHIQSRLHQPTILLFGRLFRRVVGQE